MCATWLQSREKLCPEKNCATNRATSAIEILPYRIIKFNDIPTINIKQKYPPTRTRTRTDLLSSIFYLQTAPSSVEYVLIETILKNWKRFIALIVVKSCNVSQYGSGLLLSQYGSRSLMRIKVDICFTKKRNFDLCHK